MDDKNLECVDELDDFDLEVDTELEPCEYRVMVQGIGEEGEPLEGILLLWTGPDPDEAILIAKDKIPSLQYLLNVKGSNWDDKSLSALHVYVETVVKVEGDDHFVGAIFNEILHKKT